MQCGILYSPVWGSLSAMVSCCLVACVSLKISDKESSASPIVFDIANSNQIFPAVLKRKDTSDFKSWLIEVQGLMKMYLHNIGLNLVVGEEGGGCS